MKKSPRGRSSKNRKHHVTARAAPARLGSLHILVVENHPDTRQGLDVFLKMLGHSARFAEDVETALAAATGGEKFDLLLSDISLPDGNGWDLLRRLDEENHRPPHAVAMSGFGSGADTEKSRAAGFETHLVKPFPPEELESALQAVVSRRKPADG
jgi:CheY-like chemotaxis protein